MLGSGWAVGGCERGNGAASTKKEVAFVASASRGLHSPVTVIVASSDRARRNRRENVRDEHEKRVPVAVWGVVGENMEEGAHKVG